MTKYNCFNFFEKNDDKGHIRNIYIKFTIIIIFQYTIAENLPYIFQFHENCNEINIDHLPFRY